MAYNFAELNTVNGDCGRQNMAEYEHFHKVIIILQ